MMLLSDSVGGADDSKNGLVNLSPVNVTEMSGFIPRTIGQRYYSGKFICFTIARKRGFARIGAYCGPVVMYGMFGS